MPDSAGNVIYTRVNATSGAEVYGVNLEAKIAPSENYNLQAGFTLQRSLYQKAQEFDEKRFLNLWQEHIYIVKVLIQIPGLHKMPYHGNVFCTGIYYFLYVIRENAADSHHRNVGECQDFF